MKGDENNRVIIRVWTSGYNKVLKGEDVGHVSIEIPALHQNGRPAYYSLWPDLIARQWTGYLQPVQGFYVRGYQRPSDVQPVQGNRMAEYDLDLEGRRPELTVCLYCLDIYKMQQEFERMQKEVKGWVLVGRNLFALNNNARSCSSLARDILIAGGINEFLNSSNRSKWSSAPPPDAFVPLMTMAKRRELASETRTRAYRFQEETDVTNLPVDYLAGPRFVGGAARSSCSLS